MEIELIFAFARAKKVLRGPHIPRKKELALARKMMREEDAKQEFSKAAKTETKKPRLTTAWKMRRVDSGSESCDSKKWRNTGRTSKQ
jgi:hypothetical protein